MLGDTRRPRNSSRTVAPSWIRCLSHRCAHNKISDLDCDYFTTSLHKWLYAPHGTGLLYAS